MITINRSYEAHSDRFMDDWRAADLRLSRSSLLDNRW